MVSKVKKNVLQKKLLNVHQKNMYVSPKTRDEFGGGANLILLNGCKTGHCSKSSEVEAVSTIQSCSRQTTNNGTSLKKKSRVIFLLIIFSLTVKV